MSRWKWWWVVSSLVVSNGTGFGLFALERGKHGVNSESTQALSRRLASAEAEAAALKRERQQLVDKTGSMTRRLKLRTVKAATRNASGVLLEAVPYLGIPAMLAVTAADLYDACETMKDIGSLHESIGLESTETKDICGMTVPSVNQVFGHVGKRCEKSMACEAPSATSPSSTPSSKDE